MEDTKDLSWQEPYKTRRVCNKAVPEWAFSLALREYSSQTCSQECHEVEYKHKFACCMKAEPTACVCFASFSCPVHGNTHIGSHD